MNQVRLLSLALLVLASPLLAQEEPPAVKKARAAVAKNSKDAGAQLALADALLAINEPEDAWTAVEKALEEIPTDGRLDLKLGDIFVILAQKEAAGGADGTTIQNFFMDAERLFDDAFRKNDKLAAALCGKAFVNLQLNRKEKARKAAADALGIDKNYGRAHALQGYMFYLDQKYDAACNKYEISLKLDKSDPMDNLRLGHCYVRLNKPAKAQEAYISALRDHPESDTVIRSGLYYLAGKSWKKLYPYLKAATDAAPKSAVAWYYYGYSLSLNSMLDKSLTAFKQASKLKPESAQYLFWIGFIHEKKNEGNKALDYYRKALKKNPDDDQTVRRFEGIAVAYRANDFTQFEKLMEELLKLAPNHGWVRNDYALLLRDWAEPRGASRNPNLPTEVLKRIKRSQEVYEMAAKLLPNEPQVQSDTGLLFEYYPAIFNQKKAEDYFLRALELSDFTYRDAWSGIWRLRRTKNWELLRDCADGVLGALEDSNKIPVAPLRGGRVGEVPGAKGAMIAQAKRAIEMADAAQKKN